MPVNLYKDGVLQASANFTLGGNDIVVSNLSQLTSALSNTTNAGRTIRVMPAAYGSSLAVTTRHTTMVTVIANDPNVTLPGIAFNNARNFTFQGFNMSGGCSVENNCADIRILKNRFVGLSATCLLIFDPSSAHTNLEFTGNFLQSISLNSADWTSGYGIRTLGGPINGFKSNYNTFDLVPSQTGGSGDAMELGDIHNFEIIGNVIKNIEWWGSAANDPHADGLMVWAGASNGIIKNNRITDGRGALMSGSTSDILFENNLIARIRNLGHDGGTTGSSSAGLIRYQWIRNTIWSCGSFWGGGGYAFLSDGPASGNTLSKNLFESCDATAGQFVAADHNLIKGGVRPGATDRAFTPTWANTIDYLPTNLPAGYEDVGYRAAPAGHMNAP